MTKKQRKSKKPIPRKNKRNIIKAVVACGLILITLLSGVWLILSPTLDKKAALSMQNELLAVAQNSSVTTAVSEIESDLYQGDNFPDAFTSSPPNVSISYSVDPEETSSSETADRTVLENSGETAIGVLEASKINLKMPVVCGVTEEQLKIAAGLVPETVFIGELGNAVIAGHRSYTYGVHFNRLGEMENGDIITYTPVDGEPMRFEVFEIIDTEPGDQIAFVQPENESIITLYTCTPIKTATHRLLVRAKKI